MRNVFDVLYIRTGEKSAKGLYCLTPSLHDLSIIWVILHRSPTKNYAVQTHFSFVRVLEHRHHYFVSTESVP